MKAVGNKALKDNLSKYLKQARGGETILVTDRDEVIVEIHRTTHPIPGKVSRLRASLEDEARRESIRPASRRAPPSFSRLQEVPRPQVPIDLQGLLSEIKADR